MNCLDYIFPDTLEEALSLLSEGETKAMVVAGGTDVMVKARTRDWYKDVRLIDLSRIEGLCGIRADDDVLVIGSMTTIEELRESELIKKYAPLLWEASGVIAGPQVRHAATIGGNLANACIAGDAIPALCAMKARIVTVSSSGESEIDANDLLKKVPACLNHAQMTVAGCFFGCPAGKKTVLAPDQIITEIRIPKQDPSWKTRFIKVGAKRSGCMSAFTMAAAVSMEETRILEARLVIGAAFADVHLRKEADLLSGMDAKEPETERAIDELAEDLGDAIEIQQKKLSPHIRYRAEVCRRLVSRELKEMTGICEGI